MKHPLASHLSLRSLATVVATLLGQAFADGLDRAPILPRTHAAPAPLLSLADLEDLPPEDAALIATLLLSTPEDALGAGATSPTGELATEAGPPARPPGDVDLPGHGPAPAPAAPTLVRSP